MNLIAAIEEQNLPDHELVANAVEMLKDYFENKAILIPADTQKCEEIFAAFVCVLDEHAYQWCETHPDDVWSEICAIYGLIYGKILNEIIQLYLQTKNAFDIINDVVDGNIPESTAYDIRSMIGIIAPNFPADFLSDEEMNQLQIVFDKFISSAGLIADAAKRRNAS